MKIKVHYYTDIPLIIIFTAWCVAMGIKYSLDTLKYLPILQSSQIAANHAKIVMSVISQTFNMGVGSNFATFLIFLCAALR